jgi:S1-C subfamily serine protease
MERRAVGGVESSAAWGADEAQLLYQHLSHNHFHPRKTPMDTHSYRQYIAPFLLMLTLVLTACGGSVTEPTTSSLSSAPKTVGAADTSTTTESITLPVAYSEAEAQAQVAQTTDLESTLISVYGEANPSVVYIIVPELGSGTGFVYSEDGYIVTNYHVVSSGRRYEIVFASGERQWATLVGSDVDSDLAVLQVETLPDDVEPLPLAEEGTIQVGQFVVAIGNPFGEQGSMSLGIVSALGRSLPSQREQSVQSTYSLPQVIQTDAPINPGNSGGPLLNLAGEVVGVNVAIASTSGSNSGVGFSIPVEAVAQVVPDLIAEGEHSYSYVGAAFDNEVSLDEQELYGVSQTQGAYVVSVASGSPAAQAGLVPADPQTGEGGDLIIQVDDQPVGSFADLNSYLVFHTEVGQSIELTVLRDGTSETLSLTLGERP